MVEEHSQFNLGEWWQFKPLSVEWLYVLQRLKESVVPPAGVEHCVMGSTWDGETLYLLQKKFYTEETISKVTGLKPEVLSSHVGPITLKAKPVPGLPEPTVDGWGTA